MSKKNNQQTRANMHAARLKREKEEEEKRKARSEKKQQRLTDAALKGVAAPKKLKKKARKGIRIKKNVVVRGIKVTDAESKRKVKEVLAAEEAMKELMVMEHDQQEDKAKKGKRVGMGGGARKVKSSSKAKAKSSSGGSGSSKVGKPGSSGDGMALD